MSAKPQTTTTISKDDWGLYFHHQVKGTQGVTSAAVNEYAIYRPVPSKGFHEPQRVFNKLRAVEDSMFVGARDTVFNVSFVGSGYALVHTKDTKFGKTGRRELWALHGTIPGTGFTRDAWEPYSEAMEYWAPKEFTGGIPEVSRGVDAEQAKVYEQLQRELNVPMWAACDDEYDAYVAERVAELQRSIVSDEKLWKCTNRFLKELQKQ